MNKKTSFFFQHSCPYRSKIERYYSHMKKIMRFGTSHQSIRTRYAKCAKCQIFGIFGTLNTKNPILSDVPDLIKFATCYSILTNLPRYGHMWHMLLLLFLFFFLSHLSVSLTLKPQSSPLSHPNPLLSNPNHHCSSTPTLTITSTPISLKQWFFCFFFFFFFWTVV